MWLKTGSFYSAFIEKVFSFSGNIHRWIRKNRSLKKKTKTYCTKVSLGSTALSLTNLLVVLKPLGLYRSKETLLIPI